MGQLYSEQNQGLIGVLGRGSSISLLSGLVSIMVSHPFTSQMVYPLQCILALSHSYILRVCRIDILPLVENSYLELI